MEITASEGKISEFFGGSSNIGLDVAKQLTGPGANILYILLKI